MTHASGASASVVPDLSTRTAMERASSAASCWSRWRVAQASQTVAKSCAPMIAIATAATALTLNWLVSDSVS